MLEWRAVTCNLGCADRDDPERARAAWQWAGLVRAAGWELVFAQEIPDEAWLDEWESDYEVFVGEGCQHRTRSALFVRHPIEAKPLDLPTEDYHGSYVAAATVMVPEIGEVALLSVQADRTSSETEARPVDQHRSAAPRAAIRSCARGCGPSADVSAARRPRAPGARRRRLERGARVGRRSRGGFRQGVLPAGQGCRAGRLHVVHLVGRSAPRVVRPPGPGCRLTMCSPHRASRWRWHLRKCWRSDRSRAHQRTCRSRSRSAATSRAASLATAPLRIAALARPSFPRTRPPSLRPRAASTLRA